MKTSPRSPNCFLAVNKGVSPIFHSSTRLRQLVLYVRHVEGTPATSKLQADVKAEGLVALRATVGRAHKVQSHYSHLIIMMCT